MNKIINGIVVAIKSDGFSYFVKVRMASGNTIGSSSKFSDDENGVRGVWIPVKQPSSILSLINGPSLGDKVRVYFGGSTYNGIAEIIETSELKNKKEKGKSKIYATN